MDEPRYLDFNLSKKSVQHLRALEKTLSNKKNNIINYSRWFCSAVIYLAYFLYIKENSGILLLLAGIFPAIPLGFGLGNGLGKILYKIIFKMKMNKTKDYENYKAFINAKQHFRDNYIKEQRHFWQELQSRGFEYELTRLLKKAGYKVRVTRSSDTDPVAFWIGNETIVHCNVDNIPINENDVEQFLSTLNYSDATKAIIISKSGFSPKSHKIADENSIRLWDLNYIINMQLKFDA